MLELMQAESDNRWGATMNMNSNEFTVRKVVRRNVNKPGTTNFQW